MHNDRRRALATREHGLENPGEMQTNASAQAGPIGVVVTAPPDHLADATDGDPWMVRAVAEFDAIGEGMRELLGLVDPAAE